MVNGGAHGVGDLLEHPFTGSGLTALDASGRLRLPMSVLATLNRRGAGTLLIGVHESDPCLIAYEPAFAARIHLDIERRRLAEQAAAPHLHAPRARRAFGFVEAADVENGAVTLPALMRRRARIGDSALILGTGGTFEIWDPGLALEKGDADLRELAAFHLDTKLAA